jgi:hypothetical protein
MVQGMPRPRKTLTELEPVTLPTDESAFRSPLAEAIDRQRGAERDERDRRDGIGHAHHAAEERREVSDERGHEPDHHQRDAERGGAVEEHRGRAEGEEELPRDRDRPAHVVGPARRLVLVLAAHAARAARSEAGQGDERGGSAVSCEGEQGAGVRGVADAMLGRVRCAART